MACRFVHSVRRIPKVYVFYLLIILVVSQIWKHYKPSIKELVSCADDSQIRKHYKPRSIELVVWANDLHISPVRDLKTLLKEQFNSTVIDMSVAYRCKLTQTCQNSLKVITQDNAMHLKPDLIPKFFEAYKNDPQMKRVDAYACFHPTSMCELFIPFKKAFIIIASHRYEMGRSEKERWKRWNENLIKISKDPRNVVGANNLYDLEYMRYFTGINGTLLPSICDYTNVSYAPRGAEPFLLSSGPKRKPGFQENFMKEWNKQIKKTKSDVRLKPLKSVYPGIYKYIDLTRHPGIVHIPYQVSIMSLFERYRMNIPLFFPSLNLLVKWQFEHWVMRARTWDGFTYNKRSNGSVIKGLLDIPDLNNEHNYEAIKYWLKFADFYQWPHITYFDSAEDLIKKLKKANLLEISENMKRYNKKFKKDMIEKWKGILYRMKGAK